MALDSYTVIKNYIDTNLNTNGSNDITGAELNTGLLYLLANLFGGLEYDTTKPYKEGTAVLVEDATFGWEVWIASQDTSAGAFNSSYFSRVGKRTRKITQSLTVGNNVITHNIGTTDVIFQVFESTYEIVPTTCEGKATNTITVGVSEGKTNAVILILEV